MLLKKRNFIETGLYRRLIKKHVKNYAQLLISFEKLRESLDNILCNIGEKYVINFV